MSSLIELDDDPMVGKSVFVADLSEVVEIISAHGEFVWRDADVYVCACGESFAAVPAWQIKGVMQ
ncbi:MAG: hypothetical protein ACPGMR_03305 [Pontibacterium sp.]